jgi:hypothetical protein
MLSRTARIWATRGVTRGSYASYTHTR